MKLLFKIAKNELRNLFYSPVAWMLTIVFLVLCSHTYVSILYPWAKQTALVLENDPLWGYKVTESVSAGIFTDLGSGFFPYILQHLYLFIPLLTMSIISREINNGTIKLLYSSPVALRKIVLGKYLALMIYNLLLIAILGIFVGSGFFDIKDLDYGPLLSSLLGFFLLLCALTAIGFFMSSLTTYPIVSAVASFTVLLILVYIGRLWQQYDFIRDLTYFLSINNRVEKMIMGLITTKDVVYYLVVIFMFLGFTILKLRAGRESRPWYIKTGRYLAIILSGLLIGYISSRPTFIGYWDVTARKVNTVHPATQKILGEMADGPLEVTLYTNLLSMGFERGLPAARNLYLDQMWAHYQRFKRNIEYKYVYYYDYDPVSNDSAFYRSFPGKSLQQIAGVFAKAAQVDSSLFLTPDEIRKVIDLEPEGYPMIMQLKYKGRTEFLRSELYGGTWTGGWGPGESMVNATLKRLMGAPIPKIYFVSGQLERNIYKSGEREYKTLITEKRNSEGLVNIGFDSDTVNLQTQPVPSNATTLVLADPKMELSPVVMDKLKAYLEEGRNLLIFGEPGKQYVLNPLLRQLGVQLMDGQLVQPRQEESAEKVIYELTPASFDVSGEWWLKYYKHQYKYSSFGLGLKPWLVGGTGITYANDSGFTIKPLFTTTGKDVWLKKGKLVIDSVAPVFNLQDGDVLADSFPMAIQMSRQKNNREQRIIVLGDADFASNKRLVAECVRSYYSWLNYNEYPIYTLVPYARDTLVTLSPARAYLEKIVYIWVLPALLLATGIILLTRRKRK